MYRAAQGAPVDEGASAGSVALELRTHQEDNDGTWRPCCGARCENHDVERAAGEWGGGR